MRTIAFAVAGAAALLATAASAEQDNKPVTDKNPSAVDIAATPASDLNLRKKKIPPVLLSAEARPYSVPGGCGAIGGSIAQLDKVLGNDVDKERNSSGLRAGSVAQSVVGSFIPFRGLIREVSGANEQQREFQDAITAGIARRSFLKGYGRAKGCKV